MRKITIIFTKSSLKFAIFSWVIQKLWGTNYSHTALGFHSKNMGILYYHASGKGVNFNSPKVFKKYNIITYKKDIEITEEQYYNIMKKAMEHAGEDYGLSQAIGIGIAYVLERIGIGKINPFSDGRNKWACSEWVATALMEIYPEYKPDLETVSPQNIYDFVKSL